MEKTRKQVIGFKFFKKLMIRKVEIAMNIGIAIKAIFKIRMFWILKGFRLGKEVSENYDSEKLLKVMIKGYLKKIQLWMCARNIVDKKNEKMGVEWL